MGEITPVLTCPACGHSLTVELPIDVCISAYECGVCGVRIEATPVGSCLFRSHGVVRRCPLALDDRPECHSADIDFAFIEADVLQASRELAAARNARPADHPGRILKEALARIVERVKKRHGSIPGK